MADDTPPSYVPQPPAAPGPAQPLSAQPAPAQPLNSQPPPPYAPYTPPPPASAQAVAFSTEPVKEPNFMVGLAAAVGLGLLAAIAYAVITIVTDREFLMLVFLVGFAVAFGFNRFGRTTGFGAGAVAAVVAFAMFFVAIVITAAGILAKELGESFMEGLTLTLQNTGLIFNTYFSSPMAYLFVAGAVIVAFAYASGMAGKKVAK